jgi:hypothetical protein
MNAQPPGPGFPLQPPSVNKWILGEFIDMVSVDRGGLGCPSRGGASDQCELLFDYSNPLSDQRAVGARR